MPSRNRVPRHKVRGSTLGLALFLILGVLAIATIFVTPEFQACVNHDTANSNSPPDESQARVLVVTGARYISVNWVCGLRFVNEKRDLFMVVFTGFIAFFTFTMWNATERLWIASREQGELTQAALTATERAFVFPAPYAITKWQEAATGKMLGLGVTLQWHNSGTTPTKNLVSYLNRKIFPAGQSPEDTEFADLPGNEPPPSMIGPKATIAGETGNIRPEDLVEIQEGRARFFIWGWVEYNDVFPDTPRHRTEVCHELVVVGDLANPDAGTFAMRIFKSYNQADDDCRYAPKT